MFQEGLGNLTDQCKQDGSQSGTREERREIPASIGSIPEGYVRMTMGRKKCRLMTVTVDNAYKRIKQESKDLLEQSRAVVAGIAGELREEYDEIERKRMEYDKARRAAEQEGRAPPPAKGVDVRSLEELQAALETQQANLELNLNTDIHIVEQYERRKQEVSRYMPSNIG